MKNYSRKINNSIKQISLSSFERALRYIEKSFREIKLSYDIEKKEDEVIQTVMGFHSRISPLLEVFQDGSFERTDILLSDIMDDLTGPTWRLNMVRNQVAHGVSANLDSAVRMLRRFEDSLEEAIRLVQRRLMIAKSGKELKNSLSQDDLFRVINDLKSSEAISTHILGETGQR